MSHNLEEQVPPFLQPSRKALFPDKVITRRICQAECYPPLRVLRSHCWPACAGVTRKAFQDMFQDTTRHWF